MAQDRAQALVIEDSPEITLLVRSLLEKEGYDVVATPQGRRGVEYARAERPELVILDLSLPDTRRRRGLPRAAQLQRRVRRDGDRARRRGRQDRRPHGRRRRLRDQALLAPRAGRPHPRDAPPAARPGAARGARLRAPGHRPERPRGHGRRRARSSSPGSSSTSSSCSRAAPGAPSRASSCSSTCGATGSATTTSSRSTWASCARSWASRRPSPRHIRTLRGVGYRFEPV